MSRQRVPPGMYARNQGGGVPRYYGRVGGRRVPLVALGVKLATTSLDVAVAVYRQLVADYEKAQVRGIYGLPPRTLLGAYATTHLVAKAKAGKVTDGCLAASEHFLANATRFFGSDRELSTITAADVRGVGRALGDLPVRAPEPRHAHAEQRAGLPQCALESLPARPSRGARGTGLQPGCGLDG